MPRPLAWVVSVLTVAGLLDDTRSLLTGLGAQAEPREVLLHGAVLLGVGGTGLLLAFRPAWAPLPFLLLAAALAGLAVPQNLLLVALILLALAAGVLDWARLAAMLVPFALVVALAGTMSVLLHLEVLLVTAVVLALGRTIWLITARSQRAEAAHVALVREVEEREEAAAARTARQEAAFEAQREELGHQLHDVIAHELTRIAMRATVAGQQATDDSAREVLEDVAGTARRGLGEMRRLMTILDRPARDGEAVPRSPLQDSLPAALRQASDDLRAAGFEVIVEEHLDEPLPHSLHSAATAVLREASTNIAKHAPPGCTCVLQTETTSGQLRLAVSNPAPSPTAEPAPASGFGLRLLHARVQALGGRLTVGSGDGGWILEARWPLTGAAPTAPEGSAPPPA